MSGASTNALSDFQFHIIGKQPALLGRLSSKPDDGQDFALSPASSPLSSPKVAATQIPPTHSTWLNLALAVDEQEVSSVKPSGARPSGTDLSAPLGDTTAPQSRSPPRSSPLNDNEASGAQERRKASEAHPSIFKSSHASPSGPALASAGPFALPPTLSATSTSTRTLLPTTILSRSQQISGTMPAASVETAIPQDEEDILDSFQLAYERLKAEADECGATQVEMLRLAAKQHDKFARMCALVDNLPVSRGPFLAQAQRRIARAEQRAIGLESEVTRLQEQLQNALDTITRLEGEKAELQGEVVLAHQQADEMKRALEARIGEALKTMNSAIEETRVRESERDAKAAEASARMEALEREHLQLIEAGTRGAVVKKKLQEQVDRLHKQLAAQKQEAAVERKKLQEQLEEQARAAEEDQQRRAADLVEDRRKLEAQIQTEFAQRMQADDAEMRPGDHGSGEAPSSSGAIVGPEIANIEHPTTEHTTLLLLTIMALFTLRIRQQPPCPPVRRYRRPPPLRRLVPRTPAQIPAYDRLPAAMSGPLLAVQAADEEEVKPKTEPVDEVPDTLPSASQSRVVAPAYRREQSLDYVPLLQHLSRSQLTTVPITLSASVSPKSAKAEAESPAVSPELAYPSRTSSRGPTQSLREPATVPLVPTLLKSQSSGNAEDQSPRLESLRLPHKAKGFVSIASSKLQFPIRSLAYLSQSQQLTIDPTPFPFNDNHGVVWSSEDHVRHKRTRDEESYIQQPNVRRRLTPPPSTPLQHGQKAHPTPLSQQTPHFSSRPGTQEQPFPSRSHPADQQSRSQDLRDRIEPPQAPLRGYDSYVPQPRDDRRSPPRRTSPTSTNIPVNGYAPVGEATTARQPNTESRSFSQTGPSLQQRIHGHNNALSPTESAPGPSNFASGPRPTNPNAGASPPRRQAQRRASPPARLPPPPTHVALPLLNRLTDATVPPHQQDTALRGEARGRGAGRGRGRGGQQRARPLGQRLEPAQGRTLADRIRMDDTR
ncbi:hypothetical protein DICSQDRAFT_177984 [Dichomitus squalens LYAD-421 SS1]|uniref:uncharacterized protein n=1 Tax=Dichomitus squalens (strain LYAD-421) TaxID=732165 RepID=UPI0004415D10|nr:uncharacterized protein DICSQDRAFT_177984 [Dichomitus squalens LYAD-421 SS1]EJF65393.1 hypothetical protein DICSQDRAFT_177984 [Dichomitus squalens LYAD-421 SS1]